MVTDYPHGFSICPSGVGCPDKGWWVVGAPLPGGAAAGPEAVKAARAGRRLPPRASLPAASCRQPLTGSCR